MESIGALQTMRPSVLRSEAFDALYVEGWAFDQRREVESAHLDVGGSRIPAVAIGVERPDIDERFHATPFRSAYARASGLILAGVVEPLEPGSHRFELTLDVTDGRSVRAVAGEVRVRAQASRTIALPTDCEVAIAMATHDPPAELFARQIESIRHQEHDSWVCIISDDCSSSAHLEAMREVLGDDDRFVLVEHTSRLGFYLNFERALSMVPPTVPYVALADHDDVWYPEKLVSLVRSIGTDPDLQLVASDARVIDREGRVLAASFYEHRVPTHDDPYSLFLVNSLIGASMLFRRSLLDVALPFPRAFEQRFHDHWLARAASVAGKVGFVDEPLHDYVQHGANVVGIQRPTEGRLARIVGLALRYCLSGRPIPESWRQTFVDYSLEASVAAQLLSARCPCERDPRWLTRLVSFDGGQLRELSQICIDHVRDRRASRSRRENVERALFAGRSWAMDHGPRSLR